MFKKILSLILIIVTATSCAPKSSQIAQTTATAAQAETIKAFTPTPLPSPTIAPTPLPSVRIAEAGDLIFIGDYNSALTGYEAALNAATDSDTQSAALSGIGRAQFLRGEYPEAVQALLTVTENYPDSAELPATWYFLALAYETLGSYPEAAEAYANSRLAQPGVLDVELYEAQGDALTQAGNHAAAIDAYQAAIDSSTLADKSWLQIKIADAFFAMDERDQCPAHLYQRI